MKKQNTHYLTFIALFLLWVLYALTNLGYMGPNPVGQTARDTQPLVVPAGYAFAIWGPIYLGLTAFPIYNYIKRATKQNPLWDKIRVWYSINVVANGLWLVFASYSWQWTTVAVIIFMLFSLYKINALLIELKQQGEVIHFWMERLVFSLYFAWITLAIALNVSSALHFYDWNGFGLSQTTWALIILPIVALIASMVFLKYRDVAYAGVVIWAFIALVVRHLDTLPILAYLSMGVIALFVFLIFTKKRQQHKQYLF